MPAADALLQRFQDLLHQEIQRHQLSVSMPSNELLRSFEGASSCPGRCSTAPAGRRRLAALLAMTRRGSGADSPRHPPWDELAPPVGSPKDENIQFDIFKSSMPYFFEVQSLLRR